MRQVLTGHPLRAFQSEEAEHTGSPPSTTSRLWIPRCTIVLVPAVFCGSLIINKSTLPGNTDPSQQCNRKPITSFLMLENFPETSLMKQDVRPNKIPQGQSSRRPSPGPKMLIRLSQGGSQNSDTKKYRFFIFWVRCSEYCPGLTKRRALH